MSATVHIHGLPITFLFLQEPEPPLAKGVLQPSLLHINPPTLSTTMSKIFQALQPLKIHLMGPPSPQNTHFPPALGPWAGRWTKCGRPFCHLVSVLSLVSGVCLGLHGPNRNSQGNFSLCTGGFPPSKNAQTHRKAQFLPTRHSFCHVWVVLDCMSPRGWFLNRPIVDQEKSFPRLRRVELCFKPIHQAYLGCFETPYVLETIEAKPVWVQKRHKEQWAKYVAKYDSRPSGVPGA